MKIEYPSRVKKSTLSRGSVLFLSSGLRPPLTGIRISCSTGATELAAGESGKPVLFILGERSIAPPPFLCSIRRIFILLTCIPKFIAALPGGSSGSQGSFQRRTICASLLFQHGWIVFLILPRARRSCQRKTTGALWSQNRPSGPACVRWRCPPRCSDKLPATDAY